MAFLQSGDICFNGMPVMIDTGIFPTADKVDNSVASYGENGQLSGALTVSSSNATITSKSFTETACDIVGTGFGNVPGIIKRSDGQPYTITLWTDTHITGVYP
jgi:hypothetical protein